MSRQAAFLLSVAIVASIGCHHPQPVTLASDWNVFTRSWTSYSTVLSRRIVFSVSSEDVSDTPKWDAGLEPSPPLSMTEAIEASSHEPAKYFPEATDWKLDEVELSRIGDNQWFWVISWRPREQQTGDNLGIPVLLSGKVVAGTFEQ